MTKVEKKKIKDIRRILYGSKSVEELTALAVIFIFDPQYDFENICSVIKEVKEKRGWDD